MKVKNQKEFTQDIKAVYQTFINEEFIQQKLASMGARNVQVEVIEEEYAIKVNIHREMPVDAPSALKKYVKPWNKMIQRETWQTFTDGSYGSTLTLEVVGMPVTINGEMNLEPNGDGCSFDSLTDIKVNVPFVGGLLGKFIGGESKKAIDEELAFIEENV